MKKTRETQKRKEGNVKSSIFGNYLMKKNERENLSY